jgi:outer membrane protein insertion porin family
MNWVARLALCICFLVTGVSAQKHPAKASPDSPSKLIAVKVSGTTRFSDREILAASGLQIGKNASDGDFKEVVQRLGECGLFADVAYSYSSSDTGTKLELQLADVDAAKLVPASFENFVWFTDDELHAAVEKDVPLFKDLLPIGGSLPDRVQEALQALLSQKQLQGRVNFMREASNADGAIVAINYRVEEIGIRIQGVEFPGASPELAGLLTAAARRIIGEEYGRSTLAAAAKFDLLPVYLQRGYLKATFGRSTARALPQSTDSSVEAKSSDTREPAELQVVAILPVSPGLVYSTSGVEVKGGSAISANQISSLIHLKTGEPADAVRLTRDLENVSKLYRSRGYMTVQIKPEPKFDEGQHAVRYDVSIIEGDQYKMGELEILGLDTRAKDRMREAWTLHEGQPYNADYPKRFLEDSRNLVPPEVEWAISVHETPDAKDKTVDVEISFKQR